jgi:hypothetical protein
VEAKMTEPLLRVLRERPLLLEFCQVHV